jgi:thiamine transporter ThiT
MDLWMNCPTSCFNQFCWRFVSSQLFNSHLNLKGTEFRLYWLAVCIAVCLTSCLISSWQKWLFHLYIPSLTTVITLHTYHFTQGEWI